MLAIVLANISVTAQESKKENAKADVQKSYRRWKIAFLKSN